MKSYHKIPTAWARDPATKFKTLIEGEWATPELALLHDLNWIWTEKIDGTNIRVCWDPTAWNPLSFKGRTDAAQTPKFLLDILAEVFTAEAMDAQFQGPATLYGEGFGPKIQKGGGNYRSEPGFILFDAMVPVEEHGLVWLKREAVADIARGLNIDEVPVIGQGTLSEAIAYARPGFVSTISMTEGHMAEGLVMRPEAELFDRMGRRIIAKIKARDFAHERLTA